MSPFIRMPIAALSLASLAGCGGQPTRYEPHHEMMPGPGLFSGATGTFSWSGGKPGAAPATPPGSRPAAAPIEADAADLEAYRRYQRAKEAGSDEWREFLEWRAWQDYQLWRKARPTASPNKP